jgi:hypothetical protein
MPSYDMAIIVTLTAPDYDAAEQMTDDLAAGIGDAEQIPCSAAMYEHDNYGQRVLYLHHETVTSDNEDTDNA